MEIVLLHLRSFRRERSLVSLLMVHQNHRREKGEGTPQGLRLVGEVSPFGSARIEVNYVFYDRQLQ